MRIFLAGDAVTGTGPANVTKYYIDNLPAGTLYQKRRNKAARAVEILVNTIRADVAVYSGYSKQNILGMKIARFLHKPSAYIMHGCVEHENDINLERDEKMNAVERATLDLTDLVIAVSSGFASWLREHYPMYADKIDYVTNGIDTSLSAGDIEDGQRNRHMIFSIGGGMPRKKIRHICEAVAKLRSEYDPDLCLCVTGDTGADSAVIDSYDFVDNKGIVSFEENKRLFGKAALFVQNSCFETFGLAPVEAILCGCPVLCSKQIGALEIIDDLCDTDVIERFDDPDEIASKIRYNLENPNAQRLMGRIDRESYSWRSRSIQLTKKLSELVSKK